jgi:hypothetical protein
LFTFFLEWNRGESSIFRPFPNGCGSLQVILNLVNLQETKQNTNKQTAPVPVPADPDEVFWNYEQGTDLVDPTGSSFLFVWHILHLIFRLGQEVGAYYARLLSYYTKGGFTDELGNFIKSNYSYSLTHWEVLVLFFCISFIFDFFLFILY